MFVSNVLFHSELNISVSSRLNTIPLTCFITIRYAYHSQYDMLNGYGSIDNLILWLL